MTNLSLPELIEALDQRKQQGNWIPACGGSEVPFISRSGLRLLYCWQPYSGRHAYLNCDTDIVLTDEEAQFALGNR
jgi:hypothetical protein